MSVAVERQQEIMSYSEMGGERQKIRGLVMVFRNNINYKILSIDSVKWGMLGLALLGTKNNYNKNDC